MKMNTLCEVEAGILSESPDFGSDRVLSAPSKAEWPDVEDLWNSGAHTICDASGVFFVELSKCISSSVRSPDN